MMLDANARHLALCAFTPLVHLLAPTIFVRNRGVDERPAAIYDIFYRIGR
jgi:hypothetical protein